MERDDLPYERITLQNPGGEQLKIVVSLSRMVAYLRSLTDGYVEANTSGKVSHSELEEAKLRLERALMFCPLFPGRVEEAMKESFTIRQFDKVEAALNAGKVVKLQVDSRKNKNG